MRSIGELARDSGLTVSALRFYDGAGVLIPSWVDPASGYRWYAPEQLADARLLARLRRVQLPLADLRLVLAGWANEDTSLVRALLDAHLLRLEDGLADARRELSTVRALLALRENPVSPTEEVTGTTGTTGTAGSNAGATRLTLSPAALAAALDSVRFAVSTDPALPMLGGVLFDADAEAGSLRVVATDRYRMALSGAAATGFDGPPVQAVVPVALVDAMRALLGSGSTAKAGTNAHADADATVDGAATLTLDGDRITLDIAGSRAAGQRLDFDFPDYRRLSRLQAGRRVQVDVAALRRALVEGATRSQRREQDGAVFDISVLSVAGDGSISVSGTPEQAGGAQRVGVNRDFLLDALKLGARGQLVLELDSEISPLAIRLPEREDTFSLLMPVRLQD